MTDAESPVSVSFQDLDLPEPLLRALKDVGYETPSPIQAETIPTLLEGRDLLGQAQTGTGKTAAFALPMLARLDLKKKQPQLLVLAPTRELAIQVAEAFQSYAHYLQDFHVLPIYGGQSYEIQLRQLKRGVQVVVGTPGRVMDHMRRGTLKLDALTGLVLDEADEMLRMGFIDDVEWILEHTPDDRQIALFSATMPPVIKKVATTYLNEPALVRIKDKTTTAKTIRQRYWQVSGLHKLDALTRILESEPFDAILIFVRTKNATEELAEKLSARGYAAEALNGDIQQKVRERIVDKLKKGQIDILVATDVVARGLDVERISHVINYDIPYDPESYVHRIGRTGRAGRSGEAILFVSNRETRLLKAIERTTKQKIEPYQMPSVADINVQRVARFKQRIADTITSADLDVCYQVVEELQHEQDIDPVQIAAALAKMVQGNEPLLMQEHRRKERPERQQREGGSDRGERRQKAMPSTEPKPLKKHPDVEMVRYRLAVGYEHDVKPGNIIGAIANEGGIESEFIGHLEIYDDFSTIDLPEGMPKEIEQALRKAWVCGRRLNLKPLKDWREGDDQQPQKRGGDRRQGQKARDRFADKDRKKTKPRQVKKSGGSKKHMKRKGKKRQHKE
jgi:ATP-dependent RNA helicase DeaD